MGQSKHRKGGKKARKLQPERRLNRVLDRFINQSNKRTFDKEVNEGAVKKMVNEGLMQPLSGPDFKQRINATRTTRPDPKKLARLLCPNASF